MSDFLDGDEIADQEVASLPINEWIEGYTSADERSDDDMETCLDGAQSSVESYSSVPTMLTTENVFDELAENYYNNAASHSSSSHSEDDDDEEDADDDNDSDSEIDDLVDADFGQYELRVELCVIQVT